MTLKINTLNINLGSIESNDPFTEVPCGDCTLCCQLLSPYLTPEEISLGKYPISLVNPTDDQLKENPNIGPVVTMFKNKYGGCSMLIDGKCSIYNDRPIACRQFDCRTSNHPKLKDLIKKKFNQD